MNILRHRLVILQNRPISFFQESRKFSQKNDLDSLFKTKIDRYGGKHYDTSSTKSETIRTFGLDNFSKLVDENLKNCHVKLIRTIWFRINGDNAQIIEPLVKLGFDFHHAKKNHVIMVKSLSDRDNIPKYAYTNIGVGGFVLNDQNQVLIIKEKTKMTEYWKFPGGYVDQGEDLNDAIVREVKEETGIDATFRCILAMRHLHRAAFDASDLYIVCHLQATSQKVTMCPHEIDQCQWIPMEDVRQHLSPFNNLIVDKFLERSRNQFEIGHERFESNFPPPPNNIFNVYSIRKSIHRKE